MWSIWLCGRLVGHVGPMTARCQPGMNRRTNGPHVFMSPASTASGRANSRSPRRSSAQLRCEPMCRCDMCVPATEMGRPSTVTIEHQRRPLHTVGTQRAHRQHPRRLNRQRRPHQHGDAPGPLLGLLPARQRLDMGRHRPHAVHVQRLVLVPPDRTGRPGVARRPPAAAGCAAPSRACAPQSGTPGAGPPRPPARHCRRRAPSTPPPRR